MFIVFTFYIFYFVYDVNTTANELKEVPNQNISKWHFQLKLSYHPNVSTPKKADFYPEMKKNPKKQSLHWLSVVPGYI